MLADPFWFHRTLWFFFEDWMAQFNADDINKWLVLYWWLTFEQKKLP